MLVSPLARRLLAAERAADESQTALGRAWTRWWRRRASRPQECTVEVASGMGGTAGGAGGGWKAVRMVVVPEGEEVSRVEGAGDEPAFEVGWGVYELFVTATAAAAEGPG